MPKTDLLMPKITSRVSSNPVSMERTDLNKTAKPDKLDKRIEKIAYKPIRLDGARGFETVRVDLPSSRSSIGNLKAHKKNVASTDRQKKFFRDHNRNSLDTSSMSRPSSICDK